MEVRLTEQCGSDAAAVAAAVTTSNNKSMDSNSLTDVTRAVVDMDLSRTTVNDETKPPLTKDESEYMPHFFSQKSTFLHIFIEMHMHIFGIFLFDGAIK